MIRMARADALADADLSRKVIRSSLWLTAGSGTLLFFVLRAGAMPLSRAVFDQSAAGSAAASLSVFLLFLLGIMEFGANPGLGAAGLLRGQRDTRVPMLYTLAGYWLVGAPLGLWLNEARDFGVTGVWAGLTVGTVATSALMLMRLPPRANQTPAFLKLTPMSAARPGSANFTLPAPSLNLSENGQNVDESC